MSKGKHEYTVGYGKPPVETRFKSGVSGNPRGRPKGSLNLKALMQKIFNKKVVVREGQKTHKVTLIEAVILKGLEAALTGNYRAAMVVFKLATYFDVFGKDESGPSVDLSQIPMEELLTLDRIFAKAPIVR